MISIDHLPLDANGVVQGAWRLLHRDPTFTGGLGAHAMRDGASTTPILGRPLVGVVAVYGNDLYLEPWGELPLGFTLPPMVSADVSEAQLALLESCPWRASKASATADESTGESAEGAATSDGLDELDLEALQALVVELGLAPGNKQEKALRKLIRAERAKASATADEA